MADIEIVKVQPTILATAPHAPDMVYDQRRTRQIFMNVPETIRSQIDRTKMKDFFYAVWSPKKYRWEFTGEKAPWQDW